METPENPYQQASITATMRATVDHRRRALHKAHGKKRQKPNRGPSEKADKEKQRGPKMLKLRRAHPRYKKRRTKIDSRQKSKSQRTRPHRPRRLANPHQLARRPMPRRSFSVGGVRRRAFAVWPSNRVNHHSGGQQQLDSAHQPRPPGPRVWNGRPHHPNRRSEHHVPGQPRRQKQQQLPAVQPHSPRLNHHPRHHHRPAGCQAYRPRRESQHKRLPGAGRKRKCRHRA